MCFLLALRDKFDEHIIIFHHRNNMYQHFLVHSLKPNTAPAKKLTEKLLLVSGRVKQTIHTVDGTSPKQPPGMYKNPVNTGINNLNWWSPDFFQHYGPF